MLGLRVKSKAMPTVCGSSKISNTCYHKKAVKFELAKEMCRGAGLRLCTMEEVENDVLAGSGAIYIFFKKTPQTSCPATRQHDG